MTNLIKRLRADGIAPRNLWDLRDEAAAEIERLTERCDPQWLFEIAYKHAVTVTGDQPTANEIATRIRESFSIHKTCGGE